MTSIAAARVNMGQYTMDYMVRRATLSNFLNEKAALSLEMALRIERAFGVSMDMLLPMQTWYDGHVMRKRASNQGQPLHTGVNEYARRRPGKLTTRRAGTWPSI